MATNEQSPRSFHPAAVTGGLILLGLGSALLLDRTGLMHLHTGLLVGPLVMIMLGVAMLVEGGGFKRDASGEVRPDSRRRNPAGGLWMIGIGVWLFVSQSHLWGLSFDTSWPLLLVFMGLMMVVRGWR